MTVASRFVLSEAELTFLAESRGKGHFPAAPPPTLSHRAWGKVVRGLLASGVVRDSDPVWIADDLQVVLDTVLTSERSVWTEIIYRPGCGENASWALWVKGDSVVRQTLVDDDSHELIGSDRSALDELLQTVLDVEQGRDCQDGAPQPLSYGDFCATERLGRDAGPQSVAAQYPAAAGYAQALAEGRRSIQVTERIGPDDDDHVRLELTLTDAPNGLWLCRYAKPIGRTETGSTTVVLQQVSLATARDQMSALILGAP